MKNQLSNYLLIFAGGFLLCFFILKANFFGERVKVEQSFVIPKEEAKIDSLVILEKVATIKVEKYKSKKQLIKKQYEEDTAIIASLEFDSLSRLFTTYYPEVPKADSSSKPVSAPMYSKK